MTTIARSKTLDSYAQDYQQVGPSPGWLSVLREKAWAEFERLSFPTARRGNEAWKYTDLRVLDSEAFRRSTGGTDLALDYLQKAVAWDDEWHTAVVVDGQFSTSLSRNLSGAGVSVGELVTPDTASDSAAGRALGTVVDFEGNPFVALNTAMFAGGTLVELEPGARPEQPVHVVNVITAGEPGRAFYPRTLVLAGSGSDATIIESFVNLSDGAQFSVPVFEANLSENSRVRHFRVQLENEHSIHIGFTRTEQPANAIFESTSFATGPAIGRNDVHTNLAEVGAETTLHGLYITNGSSHQDNEISTTHQKPHGTSHQFYKGILAGKSRAVFSGKVLVQPGAMKTVAQQKDLNLLLSHGAEIDTKPSLEIYADDVQCAHGATAGHVDKDMLFYLMSRGVSRSDAATMLVAGFASEIIDEFEPEPLREFLYSRLDRIIPELESEGIL